MILCKKDKIVVIIPYFSENKEWPLYVNFFIESCKNNLLLDVVFITDLKPPENTSSNVSYVNMSFKDIKRRFEKKLNISLISMINPYKLCDYKPCYAFVFPEIVKDYKYWAFGDIDLVYGNLKEFITDLILKDYDVISFTKEVICGHLAIFKNNYKINTLFQKIKNIDNMLQDSDKVYKIDEIHFMTEVQNANYKAHFCNYGITPLSEGWNSVDFSKGFCVVWNKDGVSVLKEDDSFTDIPYCHFMFQKNRLWVKNKIKIINILYSKSSWVINSIGFIPLSGKLEKKYLKYIENGREYFNKYNAIKKR